MDPQHLFDTREQPIVEEWAKKHVTVCKPILLRVIQKSRSLSPALDDSWLARVDSKTRPFETSQQIVFFAQIAADNLREVNRALRTHLPTVALYSLIRSAMEASSIALWILDAKSEDLAASRTLRVYRQNIEADRTLWNTVVGHYSEDHPMLASTASETHKRLKGIDQPQFDVAVKSTSVIEVTDAQHPNMSTALDLFSGLEVWRLCSAVTHANTISFLAICERHPDGALGQPATRTSRLSIVAAAYSTALHRSNVLLDTFLTRSKPRRKGR